MALPTGSGKRAARYAAFRWINTILGNIKSAITSNHHAIHKKHMMRYLAEFEWRFNHRFDLAAMIPTRARAALATNSHPYWWHKWRIMVRPQDRLSTLRTHLPATRLPHDAKNVLAHKRRLPSIQESDALDLQHQPWKG